MEWLIVTISFMSKEVRLGDERHSGLVSCIVENYISCVF